MPGKKQKEPVRPGKSGRSKPYVSTRVRLAESNPATVFWLAAGLSTRAALGLVKAKIVTLDDLAGKTRMELNQIAELGPRSFRILEGLLGYPIPQRRLDPGAALWRTKGFGTSTANTLWRAGIRSLDDLARADRETLDALPRFAKGGLKLCEALLGRRVPAKRDYWIARGLPSKTAIFLIAAGIDTLDDLGRLTRDEFLLLPRLAETALEQCERVLGRRLPSPREEWRQRGCPGSLARKLVRAGVLNEEDLRRKSDEELSRAGLQKEEIAFLRGLIRPPP